MKDFPLTSAVLHLISPITLAEALAIGLFLWWVIVLAALGCGA